MTKLLWECYRKSNFFITFGCLVSTVQLTIIYKRRLRRKLTQTMIFPKPSYVIAWAYVSVASLWFHEEEEI